MKRILLAILAVAASGCVAYAQPYHHPRHDDDRQWRGHRHEQRVRIPDRFERREFWRDGRRVVIEKRYRCVEQRGRRCMDWQLIDRDRIRR